MASAKDHARRAPPFVDPPGYFRHRPEETVLYRLVEEHYPAFAAAREAAGRPLPKHVGDEFEAYLKCGRLEHGFLRVRCSDCHAEKLVAFIIISELLYYASLVWDWWIGQLHRECGAQFWYEHWLYEPPRV